MKKIELVIKTIFSTPTLIGVLSFLLSEKIEDYIVKSQINYTESVQWETTTRIKAEKVAEYLALASQLKENSSDEEYLKANNLSMELAMWLPADIYREVVKAVANPNSRTNNFSAIISVRKYLLKENAGNLSPDDMACHYPNAGKQNKK
jgi:hypothetical protein